MNAIAIKGISKRYPGFTLEPLDLCLPQGSILGLVGENGAGKSTLIKLIMGAVRADGGSVSVLGVDNQSPDFGRIKQEVGIVLDEAYFPEALTAARLGRVLAQTYDNWDPGCYEGYLHNLALPVNKAFKDFSRGMKMKLAIAAALSHQPRLLILDEATSGLDPMVRDEILDVFNDFTRDEGHSILLSSHIVSDLEKICDYIAFLHQGRLHFCEEKDRLIEEYAILRLSQADFQAIPEAAVRGVKQGDYGVEALVLRSQVNRAIPREHTSLEDIILFLAKGERK